ncbi:hypothetical protein [Desulfofundulus thermosubterraneus]|uniref:Uncharacterized protein n=1 Tax=Desulfofundulus thermosubterraneus DSM 16057 TaxID=1121432 RepID=A0A1M6CR83_9FIRM|nr:hypothetical protein [Desulfofundulus thermosubterraneus]SHI63595.1 hypothetical protein SAMN02745219_00733 [Desulfofundulus thermosubterraneus DSM 16057]
MASSELIPVRSFVTACLERSGAIVEEAGFELVEVLLPEELSSRFATDHLQLAFDSEVARENPQAIFVTFGSPFLEELARLGAGYGRYTVLYCPDPGTGEKRHLEHEIRHHLHFLRCRPPQVIHQWLEEHVFRGFYFRAVFRSFEKREELLKVVVDGYTGQIAFDFEGWWSKVVAAGEPPYQLPFARHLPPEKLYQNACREAEKQARELAASLQRQAAWRMERELARMADYYTQLSQETTKKMAAAGDETKKERLAKQLAAIEADRQRREKDILDRYAVEVDLHLDHLVDYRVPRLHARLELQHKDRCLTTTVLYNLQAHRLEPPLCPLCGQPATRLVPDREGRLICTSHER